MTKYIIKNCPAFQSGKPNKCLAYTKGICHTKNDCLLKRIIKLCEYHKDFCKECNGDTLIDCIDCTEGGKYLMAERVLELLEIEECEK